MTERNHDDNEINRRLWLLVGPIVVAALIVLAWSIPRVAADTHLIWYAIGFAGLTTAAQLSRMSIRMGATHFGLSPTSAAILINIAFAGTAWTIFSTGVGLALAQLIYRQRDPQKVSFNIAKDVAAAAAAGAAAATIGGHQPILSATTDRPLPWLWASLLIGAIGYALVEEVVTHPVIATATRTSLRQRLLAHWDARLLSRLGGLAIACLTVWAYSIDPWLVVAVPPLIFVLHLSSANRIRGTVEQQAWQRLAQATDEFNVVQLDSVLLAAVQRATTLFSADEVDVEIHPENGDRRLVRGNATEIRYDGPLERAPAAEGYAIGFALNNQGQPALGELRLRFSGPVRLSERERYTLTTFAAALCTAVRNAETFAETQRLAESNAHAAAHDPLTGLANRRRLQEYGAEILGECPARGVTALLLIDLNHFKEVNDTLGHSAGDRVLVEVGHRLAGAVSPDDLVARLGGDEFAVLFVGLTAPAVAEARAQAVLSALSAPMELDGMRISVEASGGVASAPINGGVVELLRRADVAMYHAKRDGQRVARYAKSRDTADIGALTLGGDLVRAINEGQFTVLFQPIVDLGTGEAIAAEALARWHHPDRGTLTPDRFLEAIERSDQLGAFAAVVLDQALAAAGDWADAGFPIGVAVNVSPRSLLDPRFPDTIAAALTRHDIAPAALVVELTESVTLSQLEVVDDALGALRELGVRLALDDFGTGFSSLSTIARVPVYELKIDRSFVSTMDTSAAGAVVRSTIELGRSLDLVVVAEGIERDDQRNHLWELGCPAGQGHLFARPMPAHRLIAALREGTDGRPGVLARPIYEAGSVIRMPPSRRSRGGPQRLAE